jgi:hypothetical protein
MFYWHIEDGENSKNIEEKRRNCLLLIKMLLEHKKSLFTL